MNVHHHPRVRCAAREEESGEARGGARTTGEGRTPQILRVSLTSFISSSLYPLGPIEVVWLNKLNAYCRNRGKVRT